MQQPSGRRDDLAHQALVALLNLSTSPRTITSTTELQATSWALLQPGCTAIFPERKYKWQNGRTFLPAWQKPGKSSKRPSMQVGGCMTAFQSMPNRLASSEL